MSPTEVKTTRIHTDCAPRCLCWSLCSHSQQRREGANTSYSYTAICLTRSGGRWLTSFRSTLHNACHTSTQDLTVLCSASPLLAVTRRAGSHGSGRKSWSREVSEGVHRPRDAGTRRERPLLQHCHQVTCGTSTPAATSLFISSLCVSVSTSCAKLSEILSEAEHAQLAEDLVQPVRTCNTSTE